MFWLYPELPVGSDDLCIHTLLGYFTNVNDYCLSTIEVTPKEMARIKVRAVCLVT